MSTKRRNSITTYESFLEELGRTKDGDLRQTWCLSIPPSERSNAAEKIKEHIRHNWLYITVIIPNYNYYAPQRKTKMTVYQLRKLYEFFFLPKETVEVYNWE